ncbi:hypothetical protein V5O48_012038 [Marasmius crinis-equi]|uniref:Uncharacterized protein n=1 Tax=Marasmius crinis-equi TaxID=585013 RepID=A0ABR3F3W4_9AGAR
MEDDGDSNSEGHYLSVTAGISSNSKWLPRSLGLLFGGKPAGEEELTLDGLMSRRQTRRAGWSEEALHMELLAQEEEDEIPDDRELEGLGDKYEGSIGTLIMTLILALNQDNIKPLRLNGHESP